jgi:hypothetical protein
MVANIGQEPSMEEIFAHHADWRVLERAIIKHVRSLGLKDEELEALLRLEAEQRARLAGILGCHE